MIRILHFIPAFSMGGVESLIMSLYRHIDRQKVQFDFLVETEEQVPAFDEIIKLGGRVYRLETLKKKNPFGYIKQVRNFFEKFGETFQIVHCHHIERATVVLYFAKKYKIGFRIIHAHTDSIEDLKFSQIRKVFMRINAYLSSCRFACSERAGKFQFPSDKKFVVLKNAIDTQDFYFCPEMRKNIREKMNLEGQFVIGHTGRFSYPKNHWKIIDVFAEVYRQNNNARLMLVGDGPRRLEIEEKVYALGLKEVVIFLGMRNDILELLQAMDVFLLPSFYEGFCISLLEAQSTGLPCIVSDVIPREVEVTSLVRKLNLHEIHSKWVEVILGYEGNEREDCAYFVKEKGYDIRMNAKRLEEFYLEGLCKYLYYKRRKIS